MSLVEQLKTNSLAARKSRNMFAGTLQTLLAEATMRAKNDGNREVTDADVIKVAEATLKGLQDSVDKLKAAGRYGEIEVLGAQSVLVGQYVPQKLDRGETQKLVESTADRLGAETMKDMGRVMAALRETHSDVLDMKLAADCFKRWINV